MREDRILQRIRGDYLLDYLGLLGPKRSRQEDGSDASASLPRSHFPIIKLQMLILFHIDVQSQMSSALLTQGDFNVKRLGLLIDTSTGRMTRTKPPWMN